MCKQFQTVDIGHSKNACSSRTFCFVRNRIKVLRFNLNTRCTNRMIPTVWKYIRAQGFYLHDFSKLVRANLICFCLHTFQFFIWTNVQLISNSIALWCGSNIKGHWKNRLIIRILLSKTTHWVQNVVENHILLICDLVLGNCCLKFNKLNTESLI